MDLNGLLDAWNHLERRIFCRLEHNHSMAARKLETSLLRLYVVTCINNGKQEKVSEFFGKMTTELFDLEEWKDWFVLPYLKSPEENQIFRVYFSRQWQEALWVSLNNFLSVIFLNMPYPTLLRYESAANTLKALKEENESLKQKLLAIQATTESSTTSENSKKLSKFAYSIGPQVLMDDFSVIAQESGSSSDSQQSHGGKSLKSLIKNISGGLPTSPLLNRHRPNNGSSRQENEDSHSHRQTSSSSHRKTKTRSPSVPPNIHMTETPPESIPTRRTQDSNFTPPKSSLQQREKEIHYKEDPKMSSQKGEFLVLSQDEYIDHHATITHCKFNVSGDQVASCDLDGVIKIWKPNPTPQTMTTIMSKSSVLALDWASKREQLLLYGTDKGRIRLNDTKERVNLFDMVPESTSQNLSIKCLKCNPTETQFVCATSSPEVTSQPLLLYDIRTMQLEKRLNVNPSSAAVNCCAFNHNSQLLVVGTTDGQIQIFDTRLSELIASWVSHPNAPIYSLQFSADETTCFSMGGDGKFIQWSINKTGEKLREIILHPGATGPFVYADKTYLPIGKLFDANASHLLTCGPTGGIIYKMNDGNLTDEINLGGHRTMINTLDWSIGLGCGTCITASLDGQIMVTTLLPQ